MNHKSGFAAWIRPAALLRKTVAIAVPTCLLLAAPGARAQQAPEAPPTSDTRHGQDAHPDSHIKALVGVVVTGNAVRETADVLREPADVLAGQRLDTSRAASLGETVAALPGVQSTNFGPAVGRPIIRGMDGPRIVILEDGMASQDVSAVSQDHASAVEPFLADRIEILKGPAALLHGGAAGGAIGGVVNVVDGRIPEYPLDDGLSGRAETRISAGHQGGNASLLRVDAGSERYALHADALQRTAHDYGTPLGRQDNTWIRARSGALGGALLGDWGYLGLSVARLENAYGNPGEPADVAIGTGGVHLQLRQDRFAMKGALRGLWGAGSSLRFGFTHTGYAHTEFESDAVGTVFAKQANAGHIEAAFGQTDGWQGAVGLQFASSRLAAIGAEAFLPTTRTRTQGVVGMAHRQFGTAQLDFGARLDRVETVAAGASVRRFRPISAALAGAWALNARWTLTANLDHIERAPAEEELFADGPHLATLSYESGNVHLRKEAAQQLELGLRYAQPRVEARLAVYANRIDGFIHLLDTGTFWHWDEVDTDLPIRQWTQGHALFRGFEGEATFHLAANDSGDWDLRIFGDRVRATLRDGGNVPRIAPSRIGAQLRWAHAGWLASAGAVHTGRQNKTAINETPTAGNTLIDAHLSRHFDTEAVSWELFVDAGNLTNQQARVHTSFLKDRVLLPGRSVALGVRLFF